jgi:hypothetical protein
VEKRRKEARKRREGLTKAEEGGNETLVVPLVTMKYGTIVESLRSTPYGVDV